MSQKKLDRDDSAMGFAEPLKMTAFTSPRHRAH